MIKSRKSTTEVVSTWRSFISGNTNVSSKTRLNEVAEDTMDVDNVDSLEGKDRRECLEAIFEDLSDCGWDEKRIDDLLEILDSSSVSYDQLCKVAYPEDEAGNIDDKEAMQDDLDSLESDDDLGM